ncbi:MAG: ABC transporter ATP-binding protein [Endomicrobium sp.]|jgi:iron complex transport system ATP-binding protein|nr:ABC transporter ATP-binding protein [Endomicrobium sp.]
MMQIKNISVKYLNRKILKNISFNVNFKDFFGIIGKNGSGKTTLLKVLCRLLKPYLGNIFLYGENINFLSKKELAKKISFLPQYVDTNLPFSVFEFIMFGRYPYMNMFKFPSINDHNTVKETAKILGITNFFERKMNELSYGEKQKVLIAQVLVQETDIVIFDEPTSSLDIGNQSRVLQLLKDLNEHYNKTIITTLHDLNAAGEFCNKLILLENGSIYSYGTPEKVLNYEDIERVYSTMVIVETNPISKKPYVVPISKKF